MARESWYINESELDDYQTPIIQKKMSNSFVVKGCAGSGKTVLALWKAREIEEAKLGSYYVIVYTKALRQFINDGVNEIGLSQSNVVHFHHWKKRLHQPQADFVIIDEVQDFTKEELLELQKSAKKTFILFGDSAQQIYKGLKNNLMTLEQIAHHTDLPLEQLVLNHRLPKKIGRVAEYLNTTGDTLESRCTKEGAAKPFLIKSQSWADQMNFIKETIDERGYTDVGILFPSNEAVKTADLYFKDKDFLVESKYDISWPDDTKFNLNFNSENPKLMTYHSAKGLQFEAVFIPNCSMDRLKGDNVNPLYVAFTRTYQDLFLLHSSSLSKLLDEIPLSLFEEVDLTKNYTDSPFDNYSNSSGPMITDGSPFDNYSDSPDDLPF